MQSIPKPIHQFNSAHVYVKIEHIDLNKKDFTFLNCPHIMSDYKNKQILIGLATIKISGDH